MSSIVFTRGKSSSLTSVPVQDGSVRFTTDSSQLFIDTPEGRKEITDFITTYTESQILSIAEPLPKCYVSSDTHKMFMYESGQWVAISPSKLSEMEDDTNHRLVTDAEKSAWSAKSDFSGSYDDLTNKPTIPTKTSQLTNDAKFATTWGTGGSSQVFGATELVTYEGNDVDCGSHLQPVYFNGGMPEAVAYKLEASVPPDAKFTDTTELSKMTGDSTHRLVTDTEKASWNSKANISDIPTSLPANGGHADTATTAGNGVPTNCTTITDWNDANSIGWYMGNDCANSPIPGGWVFGEVISHNDLYLYQTAYCFTDGNNAYTQRKFVRAKTNNEWGAWQEVTYSKFATWGDYWIPQHGMSIKDLPNGTYSVNPGLFIAEGKPADYFNYYATVMVNKAPEYDFYLYLDVHGNAAFYATNENKWVPIATNALSIYGGTMQGNINMGSNGIVIDGLIGGQWSSATDHNHAIRIGTGGRDKLDFYEYGGEFNFYKSQGGVDTKLVSINGEQLRVGNALGTAVTIKPSEIRVGDSADIDDLPNTIYLGDGENVYIREPSDDDLMLYAYSSITLDSDAITLDSDVTVTGALNATVSYASNAGTVNNKTVGTNVPANAQFATFTLDGTTLTITTL